MVSDMSDQSLRELFEQLARDPSTQAEYQADKAGFLDAHGHGGLDGPLVAEALTNVAAGLPPDVAAHLSPLTVSTSPLSDMPARDVDVGAALDLLASAPAWPESDIDEPPTLDGPDAAYDGLDDFGSGAGGADVEIAEVPLEPELTEPATVAEHGAAGSDPFAEPATVAEPGPGSLVEGTDPTALDDESGGMDSEDDFFEG